MKRSQRLQTILRLLAQKEKIAAKNFTVSQQQLQQREAQLSHLLSLQDDYIDQLKKSAGSGLPGYCWHQQRNFITQIENLISQQHQHINHAQQICNTRKTTWHTAYQRHQVIAKLIEKDRQKENQQLAYSEQKALDEIVQNMYRKS